MTKQLALGNIRKATEFGLIELVVGKASGNIAEGASTPAKRGQTLVALGYIPADYLFNLKPPRDANTLNKTEAYLLEWTRRACQYPNPPIYGNVAVFLSTLGEISREAVQLGMQKDAGFKLGMPYVPETVINKIVKDGLLMVRKLVSDPNSDFEGDVIPQVVLANNVAQMFGVTLRRVAQTELYFTVNSIRESFVKSHCVAASIKRGEKLEEIVTKYEKLTGLLGDPLPFKRLPQYQAK